MDLFSERPLQIFVGAFACEPGRGSEPGAGWEFVRAAGLVARDSETPVTVLTRPHRIDAIRAALAEDGLDQGLEVVGVKVPLGLHRVTRRRFVRLAYVAWQFNAWKELQRRAGARRVVYHHVTFATACLPTLVPLLPRRIRVVMGPANGTSTRRRGRLRSLLVYKIQSSIGRTNVRRADLLIAQNELTAREWRQWNSSSDVRVEPNVVIDEQKLAAVQCNHIDRIPRKIVSVGLLTAEKRHDLTIRALADPRLQRHKLTIVGDGPEEASLEALVNKLRLTDRVRLTGWLPREQALLEVADAECVVLVSESEGAGWSVGEAQALGVMPVVRRGTGAETVAKFGGFGRYLARDGEAGDLADVLADLSGAPPGASHRWRRSRLPELLLDWYGLGSRPRDL